MLSPVAKRSRVSSLVTVADLQGLLSVIRLAFCIDYFQIGGTELNAVRWAEHLNPERFQLTVVHFQEDGPLRARFQRAAAQLVRLPLRNMYGPGAIRQGIRLARFLARAHFDVFHAHDLYSNIFGVPWARLARVPLVVASRRWWNPSPSTGPAHAIANRWACRAATGSHPRKSSASPTASLRMPSSRCRRRNEPRGALGWVCPLTRW